jgi:hypothetical protein
MSTAKAERAGLAQQIARRFDACFEGAVSSSSYALLRIGLATEYLIRGADWLRPWLPLDHHSWVRGFDLDWSIQASPYLTSPLWPGIALGEAATHGLVWLRTVLALLLLLGVRPRASALALALTSYTLLLSDRYHYFHHLHVLYLSVAWLALAPANDSFRLGSVVTAVAARVRARPLTQLTWRTSPASPIWPLQLLRALVMSIYLASGTAKLQSSWWSGDVLSQLAWLHTVRGSIWAHTAPLLGVAPIARGVCLFELSLPFLLAFRPTRRVAVLAGIAFHGLISNVMAVSTFGATMALLLLAFWPKGLRAPVAVEQTCNPEPDSQ